MPKSFLSKIATQTGDVLIDRLKKYGHQKVIDLEMKQKRDMLGQFFPENVSNLILSLPEKDQWNAIQQLAPGYANEQQGQQQQQGQGGPQQGGPQGPEQINQLLKGPMDAQQAAGSLMQQAGQQQGQPQQEQQQQQPRQTLGGALGGQQKQTPGTLDTNKRIAAAKELLEAADEMEALWNSGNVANGVTGAWKKKLSPQFWSLNEESNTFDSLASQAAILEASLIPGVTTNQKLIAAERTKPNLTQHKKTQFSRIKAMRKKAQDILNQYGNKVDYSVGQSVNGLPDPATVDPNLVLSDEQGNDVVIKGGQWVTKKNGRWVKI